MKGKMQFIKIIFFLPIVEHYLWPTVMDVVFTIDQGYVYTDTFQPMGQIFRLQRHWQIAKIPVACRETNIHYDINGLQVKEFLLI
jgi:hypothetical protein